MSICLKCGLPKELCTCSQLIRSEQVLKVETSTRRYGKVVTLIKSANIENLGMETIKELIKALKMQLACGGSYDKDNKWIELQGNQKEGAKTILKNKGYVVEGYESKSDRSES